MSLAMQQVPFIRFVAVGNSRHEADLYLLFCRFVLLSNGVLQEELLSSHTHSHNMHTPKQRAHIIQTFIHMFACVQTAKNWNISALSQYSIQSDSKRAAHPPPSDSMALSAADDANIQPFDACNTDSITYTHE